MKGMECEAALYNYSFLLKNKSAWSPVTPVNRLRIASSLPEMIGQSQHANIPPYGIVFKEPQRPQHTDSFACYFSTSIVPLTFLTLAQNKAQ